MNARRSENALHLPRKFEASMHKNAYFHALDCIKMGISPNTLLLWIPKKSDFSVTFYTVQTSLDLSVTRRSLRQQRFSENKNEKKTSFFMTSVLTGSKIEAF